MASRHLDKLARDRAVEQSLIAALEVNEVLNNTRQDSPGLENLVAMLLGRGDHENLPSKRELLADSQFASLSARAAKVTGQIYASADELERILELLLRASKAGLRNFSKDDLGFIRDFCLGLNSVFIEEISSRSEPPMGRARHPQLVTVD